MQHYMQIARTVPPEKEVMQYSEHIMHYAEGIMHMYASQRVQADFLTEEMSHEDFCIFYTRQKE